MGALAMVQKDTSRAGLQLQHERVLKSVQHNKSLTEFLQHKRWDHILNNMTQLMKCVEKLIIALMPDLQPLLFPIPSTTTTPTKSATAIARASATKRKRRSSTHYGTKRQRKSTIPPAPPLPLPLPHLPLPHLPLPVPPLAAAAVQQ